MNQSTIYTEQQPPKIDEGLLDLDEDAFPVQAAMSEDIVLDLDFEQPAKADSAELPEVTLLEPEAPVAHFVETAEEAAAPVTQVDEWAIVSQAGSSQTDSVVSESPAETQTHSPAANLSAEAMDEIARRVVEQMSEKVVREIAWEVVPELSELMIRKKLNEQK